MYLSIRPTATASDFLSAHNYGTGNVLFQIASAYGIAKDTNRRIDYSHILIYTEKVRLLFGSKSGETLYRNCNARSGMLLPNSIREKSYEKTQDKTIYARVLENPNSVVLSDSYFESPLYFNHFRREIVDLFSPDESSQHAIRTLYPELDRVECVSVHIRAAPDANVRCSMNYHKKAIDKIKSIAKGDVFYLVFSDIPTDISELGLDNYRYVVGNPDYIDLWTMARCKYNIMTYSTFSWWGAYLNNHPERVVMYPRSALLYIQSQNGQSEEEIHTNYFLSATQIDDTK
jgi:hypothetical protein